MAVSHGGEAGGRAAPWACGGGGDGGGGGPTAAGPGGRLVGICAAARLGFFTNVLPDSDVWRARRKAARIPCPVWTRSLKSLLVWPEGFRVRFVAAAPAVHCDAGCTVTLVPMTVTAVDSGDTDS